MTSDLFSAASAAPGYQPLAARLRPQDLDSYAGQSHILGPGKPLRLPCSSASNMPCFSKISGSASRVSPQSLAMYSAVRMDRVIRLQ